MVSLTVFINVLLAEYKLQLRHTVGNQVMIECFFVCLSHQVGLDKQMRVGTCKKKTKGGGIGWKMNNEEGRTVYFSFINSHFGVCKPEEVAKTHIKLIQHSHPC